MYDRETVEMALYALSEGAGYAEAAGGVWSCRHLAAYLAFAQCVFGYYGAN